MIGLAMIRSHNRGWRPQRVKGKLPRLIASSMESLGMLSNTFSIYIRCQDFVYKMVHRNLESKISLSIVSEM